VVPATAIKFYVYGNCKRIGAQMTGYGEDSTLIHAQAAISAGIATATATNPIWLVKTRLQLDKNQATGGRRYKNSLDCLQQVLRQEGIRGLYKGLSASYLGSVETALHLVLYERLKTMLNKSLGSPDGKDTATQREITSWISTTGAAGSAKFAAALLAYPHEVCNAIQSSTAEHFSNITTNSRSSEHASDKHPLKTENRNTPVWCSVSVSSPRRREWRVCTEV
jgi:solute carrier family 25 protein 33/36